MCFEAVARVPPVLWACQHELRMVAKPCMRAVEVSSATVASGTFAAYMQQWCLLLVCSASAPECALLSPHSAVFANSPNGAQSSRPSRCCQHRVDLGVEYPGGWLWLNLTMCVTHMRSHHSLAATVWQTSLLCTLLHSCTGACVGFLLGLVCTYCVQLACTEEIYVSPCYLL